MKTLKIRTMVLFAATLLLSAIPALAMDGMPGHSAGNKGAQDSGHGAMNTPQTEGFTHRENSQGVAAEFQIMSLASMNMKDDHGATHHVMLKLVDSATQKQIKQAEGKIKIIGPDNKEQISDLKDYSGILAANINIDAPGKYGVICLFRAQGQKHLIKFWYPHQG